MELFRDNVYVYIGTFVKIFQHVLKVQLHEMTLFSEEENFENKPVIGGSKFMLFAFNFLFNLIVSNILSVRTSTNFFRVTCKMHKFGKLKYILQNENEHKMFEDMLILKCFTFKFMKVAKRGSIIDE